METNMGFWGIVVRPGETVKCDPPGELYYHISQIALEPGEVNENVHVFVEVDGKRTLLGTLSVGHHPQFATDLVFEKEFELLHTSKTYNIFFSGYQAGDAIRSVSPSAEGDESDEEVPLAIPLYPSLADDKSKEAAVASPIPEAVIPERMNYGKRKADDNDSDEEDGDDSGEGESGHDEVMIDEQDSSDDDDDGESSDKEETPSKNTKVKNRPVETPLKTPPQKKVKLATPIMDSKTGTGTSRSSGYVHVATPHPAKQAKKTAGNNDMFKQSAGYVDVATPHPSKQTKKTPANNDMSKHSDGYAWKSCNKTFNSSMGLEAHSKAKHLNSEIPYYKPVFW